MTAMDFQEAVTTAREVLEGIEALPTRARYESALLLRMIAEGGKQDLLAEVVREAEADALSWEALAGATAVLLRRGEVLPAPLAGWASGVLTGITSKPATPYANRRGWAGDRIARDLCIYDAVQILVEKGLRPTRNEASLPLSACDAVAEAMRTMGMPVSSFSKVRRIYQRIHRQPQDAGLTRLLADHFGRAVKNHGT